MILMNIKGNTFLVQLFDTCSFDGEVFTNKNGQKLFGPSSIIADRGSKENEFHVMVTIQCVYCWYGAWSS